jgi:hypothetical protein
LQADAAKMRKYLTFIFLKVLISIWNFKI